MNKQTFLFVLAVEIAEKGGDSCFELTVTSCSDVFRGVGYLDVRFELRILKDGAIFSAESHHRNTEYKIGILKVNPVNT